MTLMKKLAMTVAALGVSFSLGTPAFALDLDAAKAGGLVGEVNSGYIAVVKGGAEVQALVDEINRKRRDHYQKIADKNGISLLAVEVRAGQKAIEKTAPGGFINTGEGWEKK